MAYTSILLESIQSTEGSKEIHLILNQIYDILAELQIQIKSITLCKVLRNVRIDGNEAIDKVTIRVLENIKPLIEV